MIYCILKKNCYISDKQCKNNKDWFSQQNLKVNFFQLGMTFHGMGLNRICKGVTRERKTDRRNVGAMRSITVALSSITCPV